MENYCLSYDQLLLDLYEAYHDARRHKRNRAYQRKFESRLELNLSELREQLWNRTYKPRPSTCFIISDPKVREVFAADFRDRIVHHLYFNYVHEMFERTFIHDSYSCIKGRGTHYGIDRLESHIRKASQNYSERCYVLKMDIRGYFMHIDRERLFRITMTTIDRMSTHKLSKYSKDTWTEKIDIDFVKYLTKEIVLLNPLEESVRKGDESSWERLPQDKSLFFSPNGCGLPIGNLTSQLFSNVYLNELDQFMKRQLHCNHYGRYVDDFYVVSPDKDWLRGLIPKVRIFLTDNLGLSLHEGKLHVCKVSQGVEFLGAYLKPHRRYVSNTTLRRMIPKINGLEHESNPLRLCSSLNSYVGVLCHYRTNKLQRELFLNLDSVWEHGVFLRQKNRLKFRLWNFSLLLDGQWGYSCQI